MKNNSNYIGQCTNEGTVYNCVFQNAVGDSYLIYQTLAYNCTLDGGMSPRHGNTNTCYNLLCRVSQDQSNNMFYRNSLFSCNMSDDKLRSDCRDNLDKETEMKIDALYIPVSGCNLGIDAGTNEVYEAKFPTSALVADQKYLDFNGNPRIIGDRIDIGACEYNPDDRTLSISDAQTALVVTGAAKGETYLRSGSAPVTFTLARDYSTAKLCTGVRVNGEFFSFTGENADRTYEYTIAYGDSTGGLAIEAVYAEHNDWYVDASAPDDSADGRVPYRPRRTLAGMMEDELVVSGDTVHAAPGIYREGTMTATEGAAATNRVVIKAGVTLVADQGLEVTAIEGYTPPSSNRGGTDPIRCVYMKTGAVLRNFTVRNGMAKMDGGTGTVYGSSGGGVYGGTAIDCVVSNCYAVRGGGVGGDANLIRCRVIGNHGVSGKNSEGGTASSTAAGMQGGSAYDSYFTDYAMNLTTARNCTFGGSLGRNGSGTTHAYNCYINNDSGYLRHHNNVLAGGMNANSSVVDEPCVTSKILKFDANLRPDPTDANTVQYCIDKGVNSFYSYPTAFTDETKADCFGGQRVYNGRIDIGCGEFDWRGEFGSRISEKPRRISVAAASAEVTTNAVAGVELNDGDTLTVRYDLNAAGKCSLRVTAAEGDVTVTFGGEPVTPVDGVYTFDGQIGVNELVVSYSGAGTATAGSATAAGAGLIMFVR